MTLVQLSGTYDEVALNSGIYKVGQKIRTNSNCIFSFLQGEIVGFDLSNPINPMIIANLYPPKCNTVRKNMEGLILRRYGVKVKLTKSILNNRKLHMSEFSIEEERYISLANDLLVKHYNCRTPKGGKCRKDRWLLKGEDYKVEDMVRMDISSRSDEIVHRLIDKDKYSYLVKGKDIDKLMIR